jgi:hypothetical protein
MKTWARGCIDPRSLIWMWLISFTPWPSHRPGKSPHYTLDRRMNGIQNRSGRRGEKKIEAQFLSHTARGQSLYRLSCPGSDTTSSIGEKYHLFIKQHWTFYEIQLFNCCCMAKLNNLLWRGEESQHPARRVYQTMGCLTQCFWQFWTSTTPI